MQPQTTTCSLDTCTNPVSTRGWCRKHYARWRRHGDPAVRYVRGYRGPAKDRFWSQVDKSGDCWAWRGATDQHGYGHFFDGKHWKAHRWSYAEHNGVSTLDGDVCHHCDNPVCVRPSHLYMALHAVNMADMVTKGRSAGRERHSQAKLTESDVEEIKALLGTLVQQDIAELYGVDASTITSIKKGRTWKNP